MAEKNIERMEASEESPPGADGVVFDPFPAVNKSQFD